MKKILFVAFIGLSLTGCAAQIQQIENVVAKTKTVIAETFTPTNSDTLEASYGAALSLAVGYRDLCQRKVINKKCWIIIAKMQPYEDKAYKSILSLRKFVKDNPNLSSQTLIETTRNAIQAFKDFETLNGVK